jgi:hypothetical protein
MFGLSFRSSVLTSFLLLAGTCVSQEPELLPQEIMDLVVMAMNVSHKAYSVDEASNLVDENPITVKTLACAGNSTVCQEQVSLHGGLYSNGRLLYLSVPL